MIKKLKTLFLKIVGSSLILFFGYNSAQASSLKTPVDTGYSTQIMIPMPIVEPLVVLKKANVVYPALLMGHEMQSMTYVENFSAKRKKYLTVLYTRGKEFFPKVKTILEQYNIPEEFKVLMAIESGFNANAVSPVGAVGYWQFMNSSAREYGLKVHMRINNITGKYTSKKYYSKKHRSRYRRYTYVDERRDFVKSTHAAAKYLKDRCRNLNNDWLLVAASYNCGVGNVWKAIKKSGNPNANFWEVQQYLPLETRNYVMNFITLNVVFNNYENFEQGNLCFKDILCQPSDLNDQFCEEDINTCMTEIPKL